MTENEYKKCLKQYHTYSDRHILVVETDLSYSDIQKVVTLSEKIRKAGNELVGLMLKRYHQLIRTKKYRKLLQLYGTTKDKAKWKDLAKQLYEMQNQYHITWDFCRTSMIPIGKKYGIDAAFALTKAEDVWSGIEQCLYKNGKTLHFTKYGELPCIRAKQRNHGIPMCVKEDTLQLKIGKIGFGIQIKDRFQQDEIDAVVSYLRESERMDKKVVEAFLEKAECISTYRPCYATLVPKKIRGKYRVYLHLTIEGKVFPKYNKHGMLRHTYGNGIIGADIGTQTIAYTSDTEVGLKNLSECGTSIQTSERKERLLYRAMDRSRRATNPQNYNTDGTMKKGKKTWKYSNHYKRYKTKHAELCRKNAINRQLAINEDANQSTVEKKFKGTGGTYIEVPNAYRASQYDHTTDAYIKKKLSNRMYKLKDGTKVQRDWYSSYLLYCYNDKTKEIDKEKCRKEFDRCYQKEKELLKWIQKNKIKIQNSGIKVV